MDLSFSSFAARTALSSIFAGIISIVATFLMEPKKQRIQSYNLEIENFLEELRKLENCVIQYWSCDGIQQSLEAEILTSRNSCIRRALALNKRQFLYYNVEKINEYIYLYFKIVSGSTFQQVLRTANLALLNDADRHFKILFQNIESSKYSFTVRNFIRLSLS